MLVFPCVHSNMTMSLEHPLRNEFEKALQEWREHCRKNAFMSMDRFFIDCNAYRNIVAMGPTVLSLILEVVKEECGRKFELGDPGEYWCYAIHAIVPEFRLARGKRGSGAPIEEGEDAPSEWILINVPAVLQATIEWLEENSSRYIATTTPPQ